MNSSHHLNALGIVRWQRRGLEEVALTIVATEETVTTPDWDTCAAGVGNKNADIMIVSATPVLDESQPDKSVAEHADQLLTAMIQAMGLQRDDVYITGIPKLDQQIALVKPTLLIAVGRSAAHHLLNTKAPLGTLREKVHPYGESNIPLVVTFDPEYLLRNPQDKKKTYQDLQFALRTLRTKGK